MTPRHPSAEPFFLPTDAGTRFCLYHAPRATVRGALVYLHPFADEMNKSRRMAAMQARALSAQGIAVLQIDLHGCGDSDGEFADARWDQWKRDVEHACRWLHQRAGVQPGLWGLRLGALLALEYARSAAVKPAQLLLWQPVMQGAAFLTQFLRLRVAGAMLDDSVPATGTRELRAALASGEVLEVAGYELAPQLAAAIDAADGTALPPCPVIWIEVVAAPDRPLPPAASRIAATWGQQVSLHGAAGPAFWSTQEIEDHPELVALTCSLMEQRHE
ncbi:hydrolase 2, exosortase A system-associated [Massilia sp. PAMC28688]|uniref:hydrolase 2, exosortase A system-associated n=1 Tax=Massilia sp. PAMC28688 TaxID=2861283 RepID=UPI001C636B74|nr:hydrolase 2, exosortase A system-associated [Massilia sp. PAMC28688]QYF95072.1 hydrolase 2, exosortase A system-associated [Massilia sp. PAMC28688]